MIRAFTKKKQLASPSPAESVRDRMRRLTAAIEAGQPIECLTPPPDITPESLEDELGGKDPKSGAS